MGFWTYVSLVLCVAAAATAVAVIRQRPGRKQMLEEALAQLDGFRAGETFIASDHSGGIAIDERNRRLCLLRIAGERTECRVVDYADVDSCQVLEDETTVASACRGRSGTLRVSSDAVPDAVALKIVRSVGLRVDVRDAEAPTHELNFFRGEMRRGSALHQQLSARVLHWHDVIAGILRSEDEAGRERAGKRNGSASPVYVADELYKLSQLRDSGVLSATEFEQQKARLLG